MRTHVSFPHQTPRWSTWLVTLARAYFTFLLGVTVLRLAAGDRWLWLFALNTLTPFWFLPLPAVAVMAAATRRREVWLGVGFGVVLWACLYGGLFVPRTPAANAAGPTLRVMTYNLLRSNTRSAGIVNALRASQADVIALEELNALNVAAIQQGLKEVYPYQILDLDDVGVISRYPLEPTGERLPGDWLGTPPVLTLTVNSRAITFVAFHAYTGNEQSAQILADFAAARAPHQPLIAAGDLNATDMNRAYTRLTSVLHDSWREVGLGFGNTFPGPTDMPGNGRPHPLGLTVPPWLMRIDYVFYAGGLAVLSAHTGPWDGGSDHCAVVAELWLTQ